MYYMSYPSRSKERRDWWVVCKLEVEVVDIPLAQVLDEDMSPQEGYYQENDMCTPALVKSTIEPDDPEIIIDRAYLDYIDEEEEAQEEEEDKAEEEEDDEDKKQEEEEEEEEEEDELSRSDDDMHE
ncbi:hypothetical protein CRG98_018085 [Punica granatum]|uniref:Uncharacterized protein n=1 Tax=Punica granatum TaxID=22663 RepID=A0A2I0JYW0_PUNGR|nr:hypothetical protein CRG98_018085 [Punica granatum]